MNSSHGDDMDVDVFVHPDRRRASSGPQRDEARRDERPGYEGQRSRDRSEDRDKSQRHRERPRPHEYDRRDSYRSRNGHSSARSRSRSRRSSTSPQDTRRDRAARRSISPDRSEQRRQDRRRTVPDNAQEKTRGKRLFGSLLGTLGSAQRHLSSADTQARNAKQQEIQKRQQDRLQEQERQEAARKDERLRYRAARARIECVHDYRVQVAYFLQTATEPKLCYRPRIPSASQEEVIAQQLEIAESERVEALQAFELQWQAAQDAVTETIENRNDASSAMAVDG